MKSNSLIIVSVYVLGFLTSSTSAVTSQQMMGFEVSQDVWVTEADLLAEFDLSVLWCEYVQSGSYAILRNGGVSLSTAYVKEGNYSVKWAKHNTFPTMWANVMDSDWSLYGAISFWVYSEEATNQKVFLAIHSDSTSTAWKDFYLDSFIVDWTGWKKIKVAFADFEEYEDVAGWDKIDAIYFQTKIFNNQPNPYTVLYFDDIQLNCGTVPADINGDCEVDILDLRELAARFLDTGCIADDWCGGADIDQSTDIDLGDLAVLAQYWLGSSPPLDEPSPVVWEDFEDGAPDATLGTMGWAVYGGSVPNAYWEFTGPINTHTAPDGSQGAFKVGPEYNGNAIWRDFQQTNSIVDTDVDVYLKQDVAYHSMYRIIRPKGNAFDVLGPRFGLGANGFEFAPIGGATIFGDATPNWSNYEILLQMKINQTDITLSTGTLYHRAFGAATWIKDATLVDVVLGLGTDYASNKPSGWTGWYMHGAFNSISDNLEMGTGIIP